MSHKKPRSSLNGALKLPTEKLADVNAVEKEDPLQNNSARVETMHKLINQIALHCPPFFRAENPDTTFDSLEECHWLPQARAYFQSNSAFTIMALHRPYIFTNSGSRTAALRAALDVLQAQRTMFNLMSAKHYKLFSLVLSTFDAIILVAAIFILHPYENPDHVDDAIQHLEWGMERFETMSDRNSMAKSALGVLKAIRVRLEKALKHPDKPASIIITPVSSASPSIRLPAPQGYTSHTPTSDIISKHPSISSASTSDSPINSAYGVPTIPDLAQINPAPQSWDAYQNAMGLPPNFNYNIAPLQPTHDLVYNDLGGIGGAGMNFNPGNGLDLPQLGGQWQFEGDFGNDSFWEFMNNYSG